MVMCGIACAQNRLKSGSAHLKSVLYCIFSVLYCLFYCFSVSDSIFLFAHTGRFARSRSAGIIAVFDENASKLDPPLGGARIPRGGILGGL